MNINENTMKKGFLIVTTILLALLSTAISASEAEFPNRKLYPKTTPISLDDLHKRKDQVIIVDVRSAYEYSTLNITGALNIPLNSNGFIEDIIELRATRKEPIVFYCNGKTCKKSYKAAARALKADIPNILVYDAGIFDWARKYPNDSSLLGRTPVKKNQLISSNKFKKHLLDHKVFINKATSKAIILDIRDPTQREGLYIFNNMEYPVPLDNTRLQEFVDRAKAEKKTLLIYDAVGKQVRWLQYYLEDQKLASYYFMKGGAKAYFDSLLGEYR
jgi:rhodanese-related sulfurtransferase